MRPRDDGRLQRPGPHEGAGRGRGGPGALGRADTERGDAGEGQREKDGSGHRSGARCHPTHAIPAPASTSHIAHVSPSLRPRDPGRLSGYSG
ncbi:hypothetical protein SFR_6794 [Streptomyces sp. FR-008]|nr:hypothetical protein SFR_6794 [Streptomyces sp. FR-008]